MKTKFKYPEVNTAKIKNVMHYAMYREDYYEVRYHSGRIVTYRLSDMPMTVYKFITDSTKQSIQYSNVFNRTVLIYEP